jgi:hypothetical protein
VSREPSAAPIERRLAEAAAARWGDERAAAGATLRETLAEHLTRIAALDLSPLEEPDHARPEDGP